MLNTAGLVKKLIMILQLLEYDEYKRGIALRLKVK